MKKYIIMANGQGKRWNNFTDRPKHLIEVGGETLLARIVRLLHQFDSKAEIIISSSNPRYEVKGARRYEPIHDKLELDRFTYELIDDSVCFLYGDTYYSEAVIEKIVKTEHKKGLLFFGTEKRIVAIKVYDGNLMKRHFDRVKELFLNGEISDCKGWDIYKSYCQQDFQTRATLAKDYILISDETRDFNYPEDYLTFIGEQSLA